MGKKSPGHIEQLPSGSWRVKVYGGTDPLTGREIRLRKTCKTERAALIELGKLLEQAAAGRQPETNATVAELMDHYAEVADWDLSTRKANEAYIRRVIKPALGHLQVPATVPEDVAKVIAEGRKTHPEMALWWRLPWLPVPALFA